jgi:hypothetical protein
MKLKRRGSMSCLTVLFALASLMCGRVALYAADWVLPDELTVHVGAVENVGSNVTVVLTKRSVRADDYKFYVNTPAGRKRAEPFPVSTYRGYVQGDVSMRVNGNIEPGGIFSGNFSEGRDIIGSVSKLKITVPPGKSTPVMSAGNKVVAMSSIIPRVSPTAGGYIVPTLPMRLVRANVDVVPQCIAACPSLEAAVSCAEQKINDCDFNWARNVALAWEIGSLVMDVGANTVTGVKWIEDQPDEAAGKTRIQMVTFCAGGNGCRGGHAYAAGLGQEAGGLMHEGGHAFGTSHGMDKADAMKGNRAFFGPNNIRVVVNGMKGRSESDHPAVVYSGALPPHAQDDIAETPKDKPVTINVIDNDFDGNGEALSLRAVGKCAKGGTVTLTADKKRVIYTPPAGFVGLDNFKYEVVDSSGCASRAAAVEVNVITEGVAAYYDFETAVKGSSGGRGYSGYAFRNLGAVGSLAEVFDMAATPVPGVRGNGIFSGINSGWGSGRSSLYMSQVNISGIGDPGPGSLSVSIWVLYPKLRPNTMGPHKKSIASTSGVIIGKGGVKYTGEPNACASGWAIIHLPKYTGFKFMGSNGAGTFDLQTTEPIRSNTWYHLVMVMDRHAGKLRAWVNNKQLNETSTTSDIGTGDIVDAQELRLYNGMTWQYWHSFPAVMDELKIYHKALTEKQVSELYAEGKDAKIPDLSAFRKDERPDGPPVEEDGRFQPAPTRRIEKF